MTDRTIARLGASTGAAYVVLVMLGNGVIGSGGRSNATPDLTSSRADVAQWVSTLHSPGPLDWLSVLVEGAGLLCLLIFTAYIYSLLRRAESGRGWLAPAAFAGGLLAVSIKLSSLSPMLALFYRGQGGFDTQLATALIDMNSFAFIQTWAAEAILIGAAAVAGIRYAALPGWLAWSGAVVAILLLASAPLALGGFAGAMILSLLWILVASLALVIQPAPQVRRKSAVESGAIAENVRD